MATTYSEPKEMLGYIIVKFIDQQLPILMNVPYDKRAVFAFYYQLKGLDSQLVAFRKDMGIIKDGKKHEYEEVMAEINETIESNWNYVYGKDYDQFMRALFKWSELIASSYAHLGLVPDDSTKIKEEPEDEEENMMEEPVVEDGEQYAEPEQPRKQPVPSPGPESGPERKKQAFRFL